MWVHWLLYCSIKDVSEAQGAFNTFETSKWLRTGYQVYSSISSIWSQAYVTWHRVFCFKHILRVACTVLEKPIIQPLQKAAYYSKNCSSAFGPRLLVTQWTLILAKFPRCFAPSSLISSIHTPLYRALFMGEMFVPAKLTMKLTLHNYITGHKA